MLKRRLCEASFTWTLHCAGPLLIADGRYDYDSLSENDKKKHPPHKVFLSRATPAALLQAVRTRTAETLDLAFYVPGTSLRGPFRAQAERIVRSVVPEHLSPPYTACDPFAQGDTPPHSCSKHFDTTTPRVPYAEACPACRLFGCTGTASRIQFMDADIRSAGPERSVRSVYRDMIGIDRFTGGVSSSANMRFHALENTRFTTTVTVTNFELWQLGLLAYVFRDFQMGLVPIGFGKTKGFGLVQGEVEQITLTYLAGKANGHIQHLGSLSTEAERQHYSFHDIPPPPCVWHAAPATGVSLYETYIIDDRDAFWASVAPAFNAFTAEQERRASI